eukprot:45096-Chlamydomonas_euryale.AAC.1
MALHDGGTVKPAAQSRSARGTQVCGSMPKCENPWGAQQDGSPQAEHREDINVLPRLWLSASWPAGRSASTAHRFLGVFSRPPSVACPTHPQLERLQS